MKQIKTMRQQCSNNGTYKKSKDTKFDVSKENIELKRKQAGMKTKEQY